MTEGKSAALHRLAVPSRLHVDLATGTGHRSVLRRGALCPARRPLTSASPHMKLGELVGLATRNATLEALRWQNGLEASYTRGLFHALGRYGVKEATLFDDIAPLLGEADLELLRKNAKAAFYEPLVGAAAHALATVCDRVRYGTIPAAVAADAMVQQAAALAANLAAQVHRWAEFRSTPAAARNGDVEGARAQGDWRSAGPRNGALDDSAPRSPVAGCRVAGGRASSPISLSAIPSTRGTPCGSSAGR